MRFTPPSSQNTVLPAVFLTLLAAPCLLAQSKDIEQCSATVVYRYTSSQKGHPTCQIIVDRSSPGSPLPVQVPPNTNVIIVVSNQRPLEVIQATVANDAVATPDIAGGILAKLATPLGGLLVSPAPSGRVGLLPPEQKRADDLDKLKVAQESAYAVLMKVYGGYIAPSCLQAYVSFDPVAGQCTQVPLVSDSSLTEDQKIEAFEKAREDAISGLMLTLTPNLPQNEDPLDSLFAGICPAAPLPADCTRFKRNEDMINELLKALTTKTNDGTTIKSVNSLISTLSLLMPRPATVLPAYTAAANHKMTIKLNSQEQIGNTTTALATVVVTWQQTNWSLSTGVVLSTLKNRTFANSPIYNANGIPETDGSGKVLTQVTVAKTYPGIISPVFLVNYRLHNFQADQGRIAFLFSGGLGLNAFTKSADFASGPSLQWGSLVFSTVLHYGRQTELTSGVHVGDQLGTSPPAVPTVNAYKPAFGIGLTYRLPLP
jgi:hypothetical protein